MKTKENGVTLITLVVTIVLILILATVGATVGGDSIRTAEFTQFKSELKILQNKVNELNQDNQLEIGQALDDEQKSILDTEVISNVIYINVSNEEKTKIQNGFRFCNSTYIKENFGLDSVRRDYLINVEYRYVIAKDGFKYDDITYYIVDQLENEFFNVRYNDKNENSGNFEVTATQEGNRWRVEISNIDYNGYINNWQVKYKLKDASNWNTSDSLTFYVRDEGFYDFNVIYKDEVDLGTQTVKIISDGLISEKVEKNVIKVGDYVQYTPDPVEKTDEKYTQLIEDLGTYSGNIDEAYNTSSTISQDSLNWRVLDFVEDEDGNKLVRLISDKPTTSTVSLYGAKGYNNAVYLLDNTCNVLYKNSKYANKVQSLKIEDIQKHLTYDYTTFENTNVDTGKYGGTKIYDSENYRYYPNIFAKEKTGWVDTVQGTELELSQQTSPIDVGLSLAKSNIKVKQTFWNKLISTTDFTNAKYYNLFINNGISNYSTYWMSSRCVHAYPEHAVFDVRRMASGVVSAVNLDYSSGYACGDVYALRPVITLNANVMIDANKSGDGSDSSKPWVFQEIE